MHANHELAYNTATAANMLQIWEARHSASGVHHSRLQFEQSRLTWEPLACAQSS